MNDLNNENQEKELTEQQKEILKQIENAQSEEELMELIEKLKIESENADVKITPVRVNNKKKYLFYLLIDCIITLITLFGLIGIMRPFTFIESNLGLILYLGLVIGLKLIITFVLSLVRNPFVFVFKNIIMDFLIIPIICLVPLVLKGILVTNYNTLFVIGLLSSVFRILIMSTISKFMRG